MTDNIFREYDIRGIVNKEIKIEKVNALAKAIVSYFLKQNPKPSKIIIGMDGRTHSPIIKKEVIAAVTQLGIDVIDIGLCPTPVFYFSLFNTSVTSGFIITASHNPKEYNGFKICFNKKSVWGKQIQKIKNIYKSEKFHINKTSKIGHVQNYDALSHYTNWLLDHFKHLKNLEFEAIIDCGNGTAGTVYPQLIKSMNWKNVKLLFEEVDGTFPNHEADPTKLSNMQNVAQWLKTKNSHTIGIGLDGDCDRMNPMTHSGYLIPGDQLLALYTQDIINKHPKAPIVFDIKSSSALIQALDECGAIPCIAPSGHSIIKEHIRKNNALLGGELSCHFFFNDKYFGYDDGIYASIRLFELLHKTNKTLSKLISKLPQKTNSPEYRIPCKENEKNNIIQHVQNIFAARKDTDLITIDGMRAQMPYGWGLIRASNTQPVVCLRFESDTQANLLKLKSDFANALQPFFNKKIIKEHFEK